MVIEDHQKNNWPGCMLRFKWKIWDLHLSNFRSNSARIVRFVNPSWSKTVSVSMGEYQWVGINRRVSMNEWKNLLKFTKNCWCFLCFLSFRSKFFIIFPVPVKTPSKEFRRFELWNPNRNSVLGSTIAAFCWRDLLIIRIWAPEFRINFLSFQLSVLNTSSRHLCTFYFNYLLVFRTLSFWLPLAPGWHSACWSV